MKSGAPLFAALLLIGSSCVGYSQTTVSAPLRDEGTGDDSKITKKEEALVRLSPFVVEDTTGDNSYQANSTLAGTRVRTDLKDIASSISVVTAQFLKDTGVTSNQDLLVYTPNTEVAGIGGNFSGYAGRKAFNEAPGLINPSNNNRIRGLDSADNTRDYFLTDIPWDGFNTGRIDLQRGPNSILFGVGSPAGIINASTNDAAFKNGYKLSNTVDEYGSVRTSVDLNQVLLKNSLALRVALLQDDAKYQQDEAFNDQKRFFAALNFHKQLFGEGNNTNLRIKYENGGVDSNNPRTLPPNDTITPWFTAPYNKVTVNTATPGNGYLSAVSPAIKLLRPGNIAGLQGATAAYDVKSYFENGNDTPTHVITGTQNNGPAWLVQAIRPLQVPTFAQYASANLPGGSFYQDKVLTDSSVFDFFNHLLDGGNKKEWQDWYARNVDFQQTFFNDKIGLDITFDRQKYKSGQTSILPGGFYAIGMEVNEVLADGSPNPYLGRPYAAGSDAGGNYSYETTRTGKRAILTADLDTRDYLGRHWYTYLLGRHVLTGLASQDERDYKMVQWAQHATTTDLIDLYDLPASSYGSIGGTRAFDWINYLGPSLLGSTSAAGAGLSPIRTRLTPAQSNTVRYFNNTWNAPASVNKTDPFSYVDYITGQTVNGTQVDNPANYVGWVNNGPVTWLSADNPSQFPQLVIGGNRQFFRDISQGFTWQGYLLDGDLVATFGWRKDRVTNYDTNARTDAATGIAPLEFPLDPASRRETTGQSRNWSGVYHVPKTLTEKIWNGLSLSALYNESSNFKADAPRRNLMGETIGNPDGHTREKGLVLGMLDDRVTLRYIRYKTRVSNATLASGTGAILGSQGYLMYQLTAFGYTGAAMMQDGMNGNDGGFAAAAPTWVNYAYADGVAGVNPTDNLTNTSATSAYQTAPQTIKSRAAVNAWLNAPAFLNQSFFKFWNVPGAGINPAAGAASGNLRDGIGTGNTMDSFLYLVSILSPAASTLPVSTVDTLSKGTEVELSARPLDNWNITLNYVRTFATRTNLDKTTVAYMNALNEFLSGDAGYVRLWGLASYQISEMWHKDIWLPYLVTLSSQGQSAPEVARWRLNLVSSYTFDRGPLRNLLVGGAARLEASRIAGYRYSPTLGYLDVDQPIMGPKDSHFDLWVGYTKKLKFHDISWHVQLNMRNVGEKTRLVPSYYQPDGSLSLARIQQGMEWMLTNTFEF